MGQQPKVFLSGGFRSNWQKRVIEQLGDDFIFFNPREHGLDNLYTLILNRQFEKAHFQTLSQLHAIMGLMICVVEPLSLQALITLSVQ